MANSDYETRGSGLIVPNATLVTGINPGDTGMQIVNYQTQDGSLPTPGTAALIDGEVLKVVVATRDSVTVKRGCGDTVPASHAVGAVIWFIGNRVGSDRREYLESETVGVKLLMRTSGGFMAAKNAPPNELTFDARQYRPYPPGLLKVNGNPFYQLPSLVAASANLAITWAHRDRIVQSDVLVDHSMASVGPEPGTTYLIDAYNALGVLKRTIEVSGTSANYTLGMAMADLGLTAGVDEDKLGSLNLYSKRDGYGSWQSYTINFKANAKDVTSGFGRSFGLSFGN